MQKERTSTVGGFFHMKKSQTEVTSSDVKVKNQNMTFRIDVRAASDSIVAALRVT